jgi:hypothetical protein
MTESVMFFGIGFIVAALLGLLIVLRVHRRARRLSSTDQFHDDVRQLEDNLRSRFRSGPSYDLSWQRRNAMRN